MESVKKSDNTWPGHRDCIVQKRRQLLDFPIIKAEERRLGIQWVNVRPAFPPVFFLAGKKYALDK